MSRSLPRLIGQNAGGRVAIAASTIALLILIGAAQLLDSAPARATEGETDARSLTDHGSALLDILSLQRGAFTPGGTQPGLSHAMANPGSCASCHQDASHQPYPSWAGTMMANATRDPIFWAALDVANNDVPGVGEFCLRCHTPSAWLAGRADAGGGGDPVGDADGCGLLGTLDGVDNDFEGVSCPLCHRMIVNDNPPMGEPSAYTENAQFWIDDEVCAGAGEPCRQGPYDYPMGGSDVPPPHAWEHSGYLTDSALCATCHNVSNPFQMLRDTDGTNTMIPFPAERTHMEWEQSDFAAGPNPTHCQDCHMPQATADPAYACLQAQNDRAGDLAQHLMVGGNTFVPAILAGEYPGLGRGAAFQATIDAAENLLASAATVSVTSSNTSHAGGVQRVDLRVSNLSGHKLPTGYAEGRRMWLHVVARDASDQVIWESGAWNATNGALATDPQLQVWERRQGIWDSGTSSCKITDDFGDAVFHFALDNCIALDNRIPPQGFTGGSDLETRPVGATFPETSPGSGELVHWDDVHYDITIPAGTTGPVEIEATLLFQAVSREYIEFLRDEAVDEGFADDCTPRSDGLPGMTRGELLYGLWEEYGRSAPVSMAVTSIAKPLALFADDFESGDESAWSNSKP